MSFLSWLGGQAEGAIAQVNPWDGGADYNSVMRKRQEEERRRQQAAQRQQQQRRQNSPLQVGTARPGSLQGAGNVSNPTRTANPVQGAQTPQQARQNTIQRANRKVVEQSRNSVIDNTQPRIDIGQERYTQNRDGTYSSQSGRKYTQDQIRQFQKQEKEYQQRLADANRRGVTAGNVAREIASAPVKTAQGIALGAKGLGKAMFDQTADIVERAGVRTAETAREFSGQNQRDFDTHQKFADEYERMMHTLIPRIRNARTKAEQKRYLDLYNSYALEAQAEKNIANEGINRGLQNTDPRQTIADSAITALDLATLKSGSALLKGTGLDEQVTKQLAGQLLKNTGKVGLEGAGIGAGYAGAETIRDPNATLQDYARNMGTGAALGGALGIGAQAVLPVLGQASKQTVKGATRVAEDFTGATARKTAMQDPAFLELNNQSRLLQTAFDNAPNQQSKAEIGRAIVEIRNQQRQAFDAAVNRYKRQQQGGFVKVPGAGKDVPNDVPIDNTPNVTKTLKAFDSSTGQKSIGSSNGVNFELGSFGEKSIARKTSSADRMSTQEVREAIPHLKRLYRASNDVKSYRADNIAWIADMPNGEKAVLYTRQNKNGAEEIINAHKIKSVPNYEDRLASFGTPAQSRTGNFGLEHLAGNPPHGSVGSEGRLSTSKLGHNDSVAKNLQDVKAKQVTDLQPTDPIAAEYINETAAKYSTPEQYRNALVDEIWARNKASKGVESTLIPENGTNGFSGRATVSNKSPFYSAFYKEYGRKPTKKAIADMVDQELLGKDGEYSKLLDSADEFGEAPFAKDIYAAIKERSDGLGTAVDSTDFTPLLDAKTSASGASRGVAEKVKTQAGSSSQVSPQSVRPRSTAEASATSAQLKKGVTSTSPTDNLPAKTQSKVAKTDTKGLTTVDRSYIDNTTNVVKKRGFAQSVKATGEVSTNTSRKVNGKYNVRSTEKMALEAHKYAQGKLSKVKDEVNSALDVKIGTISDQTVADSIAVAKRLDAAGKYTDSQAIFDKLAEHGTKGGQTIQAFSLLQNRTPEGVKFQMLKNLKKAGVKLNDAEQKEVAGLIDKVRKTKVNTEARNRALFDTLDYVNKKIPSNNGDKIINFWRAGLLTAPKTTGGNIVGNLSEVAARELWANPVAIATDKFFSTFTGKRTKTFGRGTVAGTKEGIKRGAEYMKTGYDTRNVGSKYDAPRRINYKNKTIDSYVNGVYRWMGTQDQPFYYGAKAAAAYDLAKADGLNLGYKGKQLAEYVEKSAQDQNWKPQTFKTAKDATDYAKYAVYQNDTLLGSMAAGVKNAADRKGLRWVTDFILPFTQVPSSIAVRVIDRTPVGTARELAKQIKNKSFDQRAMAEAIGNGSFGVPVLAAGYTLAQNGELTGDYPTDSKERKLWEQEGKQPYSVRIGDRWYSLNYMQPFGTILNVGRQVADDIESGKSNAEAWMAATASAAQSVSDQSFLKGLNGVMNAINDPERSAGSFVKSTAGSIVPNFVRSYATAMDSSKREVGNAVDAVVNSIPFAREVLPKRQDMFGADQKANDTPINQYLNPLRPSRVKNEDNALVKELRRLQDADNGIVTTTFTKKSIGGVELNDKQVRDLNRQVNSIVEQEWNKAIQDKRYASLTDEEKNTTLKKIKDNVANGIKAQFVKDNKLESTTKYSTSSSDPFSSSSVDINEKISAPSRKVLENYYSMDSTQREKWFAEKNDNEYKYWKAKYENDKAEGKISKIEDVARKRYLAKDKIGANYSKDTRDVYKLSKGDISTYLAGVSQKEGEKLVQQLMDYDRKLYDAGLVKYLKFKNGIYSGSSSRSRSSGGRRSSGGSKTANITSGKRITAANKVYNSVKAPTAASSPTFSTGSITPPQMRKTALRRYTTQESKNKYAPIKVRTRKVTA